LPFLFPLIKDVITAYVALAPWHDRGPSHRRTGQALIMR
jgi:hypothetical protein